MCNFVQVNFFCITLMEGGFQGIAAIQEKHKLVFDYAANKGEPKLYCLIF